MYKQLSCLFKKYINEPNKLDMMLRIEYAYYSIWHNDAIIDIFTHSLNYNNRKYMKYIVDASFRNILNLRKHILLYHTLTYYNIFTIKLICKYSIKYNDLFSHDELYKMIIDLIINHNKYPEIINIHKYIMQLGGMNIDFI